MKSLKEILCSLEGLSDIELFVIINTYHLHIEL